MPRLLEKLEIKPRTGRKGAREDPTAPLIQAVRDSIASNAETTVLLLDLGLGHMMEYSSEHSLELAKEATHPDAVLRASVRGAVLDVAAGAGRHALLLQDAGVDVTALDVSSSAVALMRERGVRQVVRADIREWTGPRFDTVLFMQSGIGVVGSVRGLKRLLRTQLRRITKQDGQVLVELPARTEVPAMNEFGEIYRQEILSSETLLQLTYDEFRGPAFEWLWLTEPILRRYAEKAGWHVTEVTQHENTILLSLV